MDNVEGLKIYDLGLLRFIASGKPCKTIIPNIRPFDDLAMLFHGIHHVLGGSRAKVSIDRLRKSGLLVPQIGARHRFVLSDKSIDFLAQTNNLCNDLDPPSWSAGPFDDPGEDSLEIETYLYRLDTDPDLLKPLMIRPLFRWKRNVE